MPSPDVLITGGAGFIGSRLATALLERGRRVVVADVLHPQVHDRPGRPADLPDGAELLPVDVTVPSCWQAVLRMVQPDTIVHLAAETGTGQSLTEATRHGSVNVVGTTQMIDALTSSAHVPRHLVLASSRAVYGEGAWVAADGTVAHPPPRRHDDLAAGRWDPVGADGVPLRHRPSVAGVTAPNPTNVYAATKLAQEHILQAWCAAKGSALSVLRLQNVYGPGQSPRNSYTGILTLFARLAVTGQPLDVYEDGAIVRDFVHVADVVAALAAAVAAPPQAPRLLDIGSGSPTTILDAARLLADLAGGPGAAVSGRFRDGDVRAASCQIDLARAELGWSPAWSLADGLASLVAWMREQDV